MVEFIEGEPNKFQLVTPDHRFHFKAPVLDEKQRWVKLLRSLILNLGSHTLEKISHSLSMSSHTSITSPDRGKGLLEVGSSFDHQRGLDQSLGRTSPTPSPQMSPRHSPHPSPLPTRAAAGKMGNGIMPQVTQASVDMEVMAASGGSDSVDGPLPSGGLNIPPHEGGVAAGEGGESYEEFAKVMRRGGCGFVTDTRDG